MNNREQRSEHRKALRKTVIKPWWIEGLVSIQRMWWPQWSALSCGVGRTVPRAPHRGPCPKSPDVSPQRHPRNQGGTELNAAKSYRKTVQKNPYCWLPPQTVFIKRVSSPREKTNNGHFFHTQHTARLSSFITSYFLPNKGPCVYLGQSILFKFSIWYPFMQNINTTRPIQLGYLAQGHKCRKRDQLPKVEPEHTLLHAQCS